MAAGQRGKTSAGWKFTARLSGSDQIERHWLKYAAQCQERGLTVFFGLQN
jgi:hypothetical protein